MKRTLRALAVIAAVCAAVPPVRAEEARDGYERAPWPPAACSVPSWRALTKVPLISTDQEQDKFHLGRDTQAFYLAKSQVYAAVSQVLQLVRGHCGRISEGFDALMKAHDHALDDRTKRDLSKVPESAVRYVAPKELPKASKSEPANWSRDSAGLEQACRRPDPPPQLKVPIVPKDYSAETRESLEQLAQETDAFYRAQVRQHAATVEMMRYEQAFACADVLEGYRLALQSQYDAFYDRRNSDLAEIAAKSISWEVQP